MQSLSTYGRSILPYAWLVAAFAAGLVVVGGPPAADAASCPNLEAIRVPGAERQQAVCLDDLTTPGLIATGNTDYSDWQPLSSVFSRSPRPPQGVSGIQVDGYFPDSSTFNSYKGWAHDAQFVIRFPNEWNGKLIITGAPGVRRQYSLDLLISDWALSRGYAYASTDKGNSGQTFYRDGKDPADAILEWHRRVNELTIAAKDAVAQRYGRGPDFTYMTGISNGGYLTRWALENYPELYDGGVDWEGTLFRPEGPHILTYLPVALRNYPKYEATRDPAAHRAMLEAGFSPGSEFLWKHHYLVYWDLTQRVYREELDPTWDDPLEAGLPFCQPGLPACDADYDYAARPAAREAVSRISLSGRIGKPMLTLHGTLDALLPRETDSDIYAQMVQAAGRGRLHRYYVIEAGNHVDSLYDEFPDKLRPILPCYWDALGHLERWVETRTRRGEAAPPPSHFVPRPAVGDLANECSLG